MKPIEDFVSKFNTTIRLDKNLITEKKNKYYLLNNTLKPLVSKDFFSAGQYLGKVKDGIFFPSFNLLAMIAEKQANKVIVNEKAEWLFICGRDVFKQGIKKVIGNQKKGNYTLIMNQHDECLGFGRILQDIDKTEERNKVIIKNIADIGDFLRREKQNHKTTPRY